VSAAAQMRYDLEYLRPGDTHVGVSISLSAPLTAPATFVMPRAIPGGYAQESYDLFVRGVHAWDSGGRALTVARQDGPEWRVGEPGQQVARLAYAVDLADMEREILDASAASKVRDGYVGLLGYCVFGFVEGTEDQPVDLRIQAPEEWPVFTTLAPSAPAATGVVQTHAATFYALADSQVVLGPAARIRRVPGDPTLYLVVYAETDEDLDIEGAVARQALDAVSAYFGHPPFAHYTVFEELLRPISPRHDYGFSMEHLESGTFFMGVDRALTVASPESQRQINLANYAHHMAHSWIPKHAYGVHYFPHRWEVAPIIDTIWFNEGFGRYASIDALADAMPKARGAAFRARSLARLQAIVDEAPPVIRGMSLVELSRVASVLYSSDFRTGMNTFSRGALMAAEMDQRIQKTSGGTKRLRDALRGMPDWVARHGSGFRVDEFPGIIQEATGVDVADVFERWLAAPEPTPPSRQ